MKEIKKQGSWAVGRSAEEVSARMREIAKKKWAGVSAEERKAYGRMMVEARGGKKKKNSTA